MPADAALVCLVPRPDAAVRLFCLPYAGGSATAFRSWRERLPPTVEAFAVELPGRGARLLERPVRRVAELVPGLAQAVRALLDRPFAVFGHSLGALLGFELARELRRGGAPLPFHLFVAARRAPHVAQGGGRSHDLPDAELLAHLRRLNGTPPEVLADAQLMRFLLPTLRADLELVDTYVYVDERPLDCPITVFGGTEDPLVRRADLEAWRGQTASLARVLEVPGDHFFVRSAEGLLLETIAAGLVPPVTV